MVGNKGLSEMTPDAMAAVNGGGAGTGFALAMGVLGGAIGTVFCPGLGTAIGADVGLAIGDAVILATN